MHCSRTVACSPILFAAAMFASKKVAQPSFERWPSQLTVSSMALHYPAITWFISKLDLGS